MKKKILIIALIVVVLIGGVFAGLYFFTDMFKSPKTLFFKYMAKSAEPLSEYSYDDFLESLKKQTTTTSSSTSKITVDANVDELTKALDVYDIDLSKASIDLATKQNPSEDKAYANLSITYKNEKIANAELLIRDNKYGIKDGDIYDDYIYVENSNLKALATKLGIDNSTIPDSFEKIDLYDLYYISKDTRESIKDRYKKVLDKELDKDMFSSEKNVEIDVNGKDVKANAYTLTLKPSDLYNLMIAMLETLEKDDETLDLFMEKYEMLNIDTLAAETTDEDLSINKDDIKSALSEMIISLEESAEQASQASGKLKITVYAAKGKTVKIELKSGSETMFIDFTQNKKDGTIGLYVKEDGDTLLSIINKYEVKDNTTTGTIVANYDGDEIGSAKYSLLKKKDEFKLTVTATSPELEGAELELVISNKGVVGEGTNTSNLSLKLDYDDQYLKLNMDTTTEYGKSVEFDNFTSSNSICLNTATDAELQQLSTDISTNFETYLTKTLGIDSSALNNSSTINTNTIGIDDMTLNTDIDTLTGTELDFTSL